MNKPNKPPAQTLAQTAMKQIVLALSREYDQWKDQRRSDGVRRAYEICDDLYSSWTIATEKQIEALFSNSIGHLPNAKAFIYLRPVRQMTNWIVPVLTLSFDFEADLHYMRLRLMLFTKDQRKNALQAIGFRFESPESEGDGLHNYYHAQIISLFDKDNALTAPPCPEWLPVTQPAFALDATSPLGLLVCMLVSLYGPEYVWNGIIREHAQIIQADLQDIAWLKRPRAPIFILPDPAKAEERPVDNLMQVEGIVRPNTIGSTIDRVELFVKRANDEHHWNGQSWIKVSHPLGTALTGNQWKSNVNLTKDKLKKGRYQLRAVVHDQARGINSTVLDVYVK